MCKYLFLYIDKFAGEIGGTEKEISGGWKGKSGGLKRSLGLSKKHWDKWAY